MGSSALLVRLSTLLAVLGLARCHSVHSPAACLSQHCEIQLSSDLTLRYMVHIPDGFDYDDGDECKECKIGVQLLYDGYTWLGMGASSDGKMIGSHAIIGQPGISSPKSYKLSGKSKDAIDRTGAKIEDGNIEFVEGQTVMDFTISLDDWGVPAYEGQTGIDLTGPFTFIWAHGDEGDASLEYHGPSGKSSYTIDNLLNLSSEQHSANSMTMQQMSSTRSKWLAHGVMAFLAWGVFAPLAVTTAILRDCKVPSFLEGLASKLSKYWLYVHVGLNTAAYFFTVVVFSLAVSNINRENFSHWEHGHSKMGLAMFVLASYQVIWGYFRPSSELMPRAKEANENGEGGLENENGIGDHQTMHMKSMHRQLWELLHHLIGIALFLFGVWQMYEGIELYHHRYDTSGSGAVFGFYIIWMTLWTVIIVGGTVYKYYLRSRGLGGDVVEESGKETEMPRQSEAGNVTIDDNQEF